MSPGDSTPRPFNADDAPSLGSILESFRTYLMVIADRELDSDLRAKGGASDVVQETFLEAHRDYAQFQGRSGEELRAWLRRLLLNNMANFRRRYRATDKRDAGREVAVQALGSSVDWHNQLGADSTTPSMCAMEAERDTALERAIQKLPAEYQQVIYSRYRDELPFEEIGRQLNRSSDAVRQLWSRAIERLEKALSENE
jgi:RNA polymerase sigma-70 factor, ECF subfamily